MVFFLWMQYKLHVLKGWCLSL